MLDQLTHIDNPSLDATQTPDMREAALRLAIEQFYFGYRAFTVQPDRILAQRGLSRVHHRILYFVGRNPRISVNALLNMLSVSKQALNAPLRQLMDMQLVMIDTATHDKRVRELSLTPAGAELEAQLTGTQMQQLQTVFAQVGANAEAGWHQVMRSLSGQG
ncbi:MarR family transcriptional regulator [Methylomonas sp. MO1]|uniref:MarR family winged helix-turn-helix transcriptional regulator n=1 Tax=Methylomonas sp. MO1 TaxID=3073619 RepID=UPI0028A34C0F|nr:MarR family transcriptional regulator [Methylomonas sp. MO1]MDT4289482.1 MarR family transcriptional regulator [Methylomonas sp. MO1]